MRTLIIGLGRIGRLTARQLLAQLSPLQWVGAVELQADPAIHSYLINFDSSYGPLTPPLRCTESGFETSGGQTIPLFSDVKAAITAVQPDLILECSGDPVVANTLVELTDTAAFKVVFSSQTPEVKGRADTLVWVYGVNDAEYQPALHRFAINPGCLNNCLIPLLATLTDKLEVHSGTFVSVHSVTNTQPPLDRIAKNPRWSRAAFENLVPAGHDPSQLIARFFPTLGDRLIGRTVRAPVAHTSYVTVTLDLSVGLTVERLHHVLATSPIRPSVFGIDDRPLVSSDYKFESRSSVVDGTSIRVLDGRMAFFSAWYNNEWAFAQRMIDLATACAVKVSETP